MASYGRDGDLEGKYKMTFRGLAALGNDLSMSEEVQGSSMGIECRIYSYGE